MSFATQLERDFIATGKAPSTAAKYVRELRGIAGGEFTDLDFLNDVANVYAGICTTVRGPASENTIKSKLTTILATLTTTGRGDHDIYDDYRKLFNGVAADLTAHAVSGEKTTREAAAWRPLSELMAVFETAKTRTATRGDRTDYFLLSLYLALPPRRVLDYAEMFILRGKPPADLPTNHNYFVVAEGRMIFNVHKNASTAGTEYLTVNTSPEFMAAWSVYQANLPPLSPSVKYTMVRLLQHANGTPYNEDKIRNSLYRLLGHGIGAGMIRKIVASEQAAHGKTVLEEMTTLARNMGHSLATHVRDYVKI
jgi:hypothetical protein